MIGESSGGSLRSYGVVVQFMSLISAGWEGTVVGAIGQLRGTLPGEFQGIEVFRMKPTGVSTAEAYLSGIAGYTGLMDAQHAMVGIKEVERFSSLIPLSFVT